MSAEQTSARVSGREFARLAGCDEKQVRRALDRGTLVADASGKLDVSQVHSEWRRPRVDSREVPAPPKSKRGKSVRRNVRTPKGDSVAGVPKRLSAESASLKRAVAHKEDYAGRLKELEYRQRAGELIDLGLARQVLFDEARAARDAWLNWPTRFAALIAAELGLEADRVAEVLTNYVHKQLATLGEPGGEFRKG